MVSFPKSGHICLYNNNLGYTHNFTGKLNIFYYQVALHMRAYRTFKNVKGVTCKNGEEWLIKMADTEARILDVYEEVCACCFVFVIV